jgi:hypothetical protein
MVQQKIKVVKVSIKEKIIHKLNLKVMENINKKILSIKIIIMNKNLIPLKINQKIKMNSKNLKKLKKKKKK